MMNGIPFHIAFGFPANSDFVLDDEMRTGFRVIIEEEKCGKKFNFRTWQFEDRK